MPPCFPPFRLRFILRWIPAFAGIAFFTNLGPILAREPLIPEGNGRVERSGKFVPSTALVPNVKEIDPAARTSTSNSSTGTVPDTWVRLVRTGSTITACKSSNGTTWTQVGILSAAFPANCCIGLAVASGSNSTLNSSQFSNVSVSL